MVEFNNIDTMEKLEEISDYLNYGLNATVEKQLGKIDSELEKKYAVERLNHFVQGKDNAFTSSNNIRTNIKNIDRFYINILLIKSAIERYAFNVIKLKKTKMESNEDIVAETIAMQIADGHLNDILTWINSDNRVISMLVENHINFSYKSNVELKKAYFYMCRKNSIASKALDNLSLGLSSKTVKLK